MKTNVKGLIITVILFLGLVNIKYPHFENNIGFIKNNQKEIKVVSANKLTTSKNLKVVKENTNAKDQKNNEETVSQESKKQISSVKDTGEKHLSRGGSINTEIDITLTFYTSLAEENGGFSGINCSGKKLTPGTVANNVLPLGTEIHTREFGNLTVADRGGSNFDTIHRLDVYVPREIGESDKDYLRRVNDMGKVKVKGYLVK